MAKKAPGPKEEALRKLREQQQSGDAADVLKQIEADEREAFAKFQEEQKAKREKALGKILEPLRTRREELDQIVRDALKEQDEIEKQIAKLTGATVKPKGGAAASGGRMKAADKAAYAEKAEAFVKGKEGVSRSEVAEHLGIAPAQAATVLKSLLKDKKVKVEGQKAAARYHAA